jgi:benzodiazapine receptor
MLLGRQFSLGCVVPTWPAIEVLMLWLSIIATIAAFHRVNTVAAWLLLPYLAWVTFAAALNLTIWRLNRQPLWRS